MTPKKASPKQVQVLYAIVHRETRQTSEIHAFRAHGLEVAGKPKETQRATYDVLLACARYEWVERAVVDEDARRASPNDGSGMEWFATEAGKEALERGHAALQERKGNDVGTTTEAPPEQKPAWGGGNGKPPEKPDTSTTQEDAADLKQLDDDPVIDEDGGESEIVEPEDAGTEKRETRHTTNGEQMTFTLEIGGAKPTSSVLKVGAKQITFKDREFAKGDVIAFEGELRIVEVGARDKKRGTERFQVAVIDRIDVAEGGE